MVHAATLAIVGILGAHAAVTLDRIAIVVENQPVKDSDIERDIRVTAFLNGDRPDVGPDARKQAASRLIDQALIRGEIELAQYPEATSAEIQGMLAQVRKRFGSQAAYTAALARDGLTDAKVKTQLGWQITVLHFIEQRFRPGVMIPDQDVQTYFERHASEFRSKAGGKPVALTDVREDIETQLAGERVNQEFFGWLEQKRKDAHIKYLEAELK
jgi:hypothetical protein